MKKKLVALSLALTMVLSLTPALAAGVEDKFPAVNEYPGYADVPAGIWYEANTKLCYETGLITGTSAGFQPERNMKVSEVAAIAARIDDILKGGDGKLPTSDPWYQSSLDHLAALGVTGLDTPDANATRSDFLAMLAAVVPEALLTPINNIAALPDTTDAAVLRFYRAGILTGTDQYGTFAAGNSLSRMEGAAMVSRVVRENLRKSFVPADYTPFTAAGVKPGDVFFAGGIIAESYLNAAMTHITALESSCKTQGIEFNWFNTVGDKSFLDFVNENALSDLGVDKSMGTDNYRNFDLQVFYSRYLDLKGTTA